MCVRVARRVRSGSGVSVTSVHPTDQRVQEESAEEEEKELEKKLPGQHLSFQPYTVTWLKYAPVAC